MVNFEGETYPLREVADVSKKDPKRVVIDTSAIPQVITSTETLCRKTRILFSLEKHFVKTAV